MSVHAVMIGTCVFKRGKKKKPLSIFCTEFFFVFFLLVFVCLCCSFSPLSYFIDLIDLYLLKLFWVFSSSGFWFDFIYFLIFSKLFCIEHEK